MARGAAAIRRDRKQIEWALEGEVLSHLRRYRTSGYAGFKRCSPRPTIRAVYGLGPDAVKALIRRELKPGSYWAWRKRVRHFSDRREVYK